MDFYGVFDWVANSMPVGRCDDTCFQELDKWQYDVSYKKVVFDLTPHILKQASNISSQSIGVTDVNPNIPAFLKFVVNLTSTEQEQYVYCFNEFTSEAPPYLTFAIPENCRKASRQAKLQEPGEKKYQFAHHMQRQMKLHSRIRPRL